MRDSVLAAIALRWRSRAARSRSTSASARPSCSQDHFDQLGSAAASQRTPRCKSSAPAGFSANLQNPAATLPRTNHRLAAASKRSVIECLKTIAHPHRLRMIQMLLGGRYTVGELAEACAIPGHMASEHLRLMQRSGLLTVEKDGRKAYYLVAERHLANIMACVEARFGGN